MAKKIIDDVTDSPSRLLQERHVYKPFLYPWCYEAWLTQQRIHWLPEEVPLAEDVRDWKKKTDAVRKKPDDADFPLLHAIRCGSEQLLHEALLSGIRPR